jgi:Ca2+:H+ antiporter
MGFTRSDWRLIGLAGIVTLAAGITYYGNLGGTIAPFVISALALALLASLVGRSVEALGDRLGAGATGVVQGALGNLPELFVVLFALKAKLYDVATASLIGSILANLLLVLGLAFLVGGIKNGTQKFQKSAARTIAMLLVLSVAALVVPALTFALHTPAREHERALSIVVSLLLLGLFVASLPGSLKRHKATEEPAGKTPATEAASAAEGLHGPNWPLAVAIGMLAITGIGAAFVSDWFVAGLTPAMDAMGISQAFAGLVIVAIAGNAVENTAGLVLAWKGRSDLAISVVKNSVAQIAAFLFPLLVLISFALSTTLTFSLAPVYTGALALTALALWQVTGDGEAAEFEGWALVSLYVIMGALALYE